jgi:hypothetical protein
MEAVPLFVRKILGFSLALTRYRCILVSARRERERKEEAMEIHAYKYGTRKLPYYEMSSLPKDGFMCAGEGGTVDGFKYYNFIYYTNRLDREVADHYDLEYFGATYLKAEEL